MGTVKAKFVMDEISRMEIAEFIAVNLEYEFGYVPRVFELSVNGHGQSIFRKLSCAECPIIQQCFRPEMCNCYNSNEYAINV